MKHIYLLLLIYASSYAQQPCKGIPIVDYAGTTYNTVQIGYQCWLKENLNVGIRINDSLDQMNNSRIEKYCYNNYEPYCTEYGGLYQWNEAMLYSKNQGTKGICPIGWHIPTITEYDTLRTKVNNDGNKLKETDQGSGHGEGDNTYGFSALLAGYHNYSGLSYLMGHDAFSWSSSEYDSVKANFMYLSNYTKSINLSESSKKYGYSVRCIKD